MSGRQRSMGGSSAEVRDRAQYPGSREPDNRGAVRDLVTQDKIYCVYIASNEAEVLEHAKQGGFPVDSVSEVRQMIDPTTAE